MRTNHTIPESRSIHRIKNIAIAPKIIRWGREKFGISGFAMWNVQHASYQWPLGTTAS
jgi:hypothetical protein